MRLEDVDLKSTGKTNIIKDVEIKYKTAVVIKCVGCCIRGLHHKTSFVSAAFFD